MVANATLNSEFSTAEHLVELLERERSELQAAVWTIEEEGRGRLYLVPRDLDDSNLRQTIRVAYVISKHKDELPGRHDLLFSVVDANNPVVRAALKNLPGTGRVRGAYSDGTYVDEAYVFRRTA